MSGVSEGRSWWSRECGVRDVLRTGLPLVISTSTFAVMYFCDRMFLTWYDTQDMAAVMQAGTVSWSASAFFFGLAGYAIAFVAQYRGSGRPDRIGAVIWHSCYVAIASVPFFAVIAHFSNDLFRFFEHAPDLIDRQSSYIRIMTVGMPGMVAAAGLNAFFVGLDRTRIVMLIDIASALLNVVLDYVWIFGLFGFPEWGLEGAAWATVVAIWFKVFAYILLILWQTDREVYQFGKGWRFDPSLAWRLIRFGGPNGLQFLLEGSTFTVVLLFLGKLDPLAMEATTLAISVNLVAFVPIIGIAMAVTTIVGNQIGRCRPDLAERATWSGVVIGTSYSGIFAVVYVAFPSAFLFFHDLDPVKQADLLEWSTFLLRFVALYCLFDAWQLIFAAAIKGAGDTWFTVQTLLVTTLLVVVGGWALEPFVGGFDGKVIWWWSCLTGWLMLLAVAFIGRFFQGKWRTMSVIEENEPLPVFNPEISTALMRSRRGDASRRTTANRKPP